MSEPNKAPTFPKINDPDYKEPPTVADYRKRVEDIGANAHDAPDVIGEYHNLVAVLLNRIDALETALMPFATHALALANMQMCLTAEGRHGEPAGGTWLNGLQSAQMQTNAISFYLAADIVGRAKVEQRVLAALNKIREANNAATEKAAHVENNTLVGPVGGPVDGQVH